MVSQSLHWSCTSHVALHMRLVPSYNGVLRVALLPIMCAQRHKKRAACRTMLVACTSQLYTVLPYMRIPQLSLQRQAPSSAVTGSIPFAGTLMARLSSEAVDHPPNHLQFARLPAENVRQSLTASFTTPLVSPGCSYQVPSRQAALFMPSQPATASHPPPEEARSRARAGVIAQCAGGRCWPKSGGPRPGA